MTSQSSPRSTKGCSSRSLRADTISSPSIRRPAPRSSPGFQLQQPFGARPHSTVFTRTISHKSPTIPNGSGAYAICHMCPESCPVSHLISYCKEREQNALVVPYMHLFSPGSSAQHPPGIFLETCRYVGDILVAINPFERIGIYGPMATKRYANVYLSRGLSLSLPPHPASPSTPHTYQPVTVRCAVHPPWKQCCVHCHWLPFAQCRPICNTTRRPWKTPSLPPCIGSFTPKNAPPCPSQRTGAQHSGRRTA